MTIRPVSGRDELALRSFLTGLGPEARRLRFFSGAADITKAAQWAAGTGEGRGGLVAYDEMGRLAGHAGYVQLDDDRAEVAVEVADHLQGRGLGTILVERLAAVAEELGITRFVAEVLRENRAMLDVFRDGFDARVSLQDGTDTVEFPTASWRLARERFPTAAPRRGPAQAAALIPRPPHTVLGGRAPPHPHADARGRRGVPHAR